MSVTDRIREMDSSREPRTDASPTDTGSTTLAAVDPTARRVSGLLRELGVLFDSMTDKDWLTRQMQIILDAIREEIEEEPALFASQGTQGWLVQFAKLMEWTATGDYSRLSPDLISVACAIDGIPVPSKQGPLWEYNSNRYDPLAGEGKIFAPMIEPGNAAH